MTTSLPLNGAEASEWIAALSGIDRKNVESLLSVGMSEEAVAELWLSSVSAKHTAPFGGASQATKYLDSVKAEFHKLVCGDADYEEIRAQAAAMWDKGKTPIVSIMAAAIAVKVGIAIAVLTPVIALLLSAACKVGINAWCNIKVDT